jgi:tetratricopeptide (TPR) repeat protein
MAFGGATAGVIFDSILNREPVPACRLNPDLPLELQRIIDKCLEKDPALRYQHASEIRADFKRLKRDSDSGKLPAYASTATIAERSPGRSKGKWIVAAAAAVFVTAGYFYFHKTPKLTAQDKIVLGDFTNTTGESVFDLTLRQGLAVQLEQSPFLSLVSEERVQQALRLMGQPADAKLTPEISKQICERTASAAVLNGSIARLGSQYVVGLRAEICRTGEILDQEQGQAAKQEDILIALSSIASRFRTRVGESLATIEQHDTPLPEATTPSLEALKAYSTAMKVGLSEGLVQASLQYKRAIEIDPNFAMAQANLGLIYSILGESARSIESLTNAHKLQDRVSDREKFFITANYERAVTGNLEKAIQTCELWSQAYPRETDHALCAGYISQGTANYEKSIEESAKVLAVDPEFKFAYETMAFSDFYLNRVAEAESTIQRAAEHKLDGDALVALRYYLSFLGNDEAGMEQQVVAGKGKPGIEDWIAQSQALVAAYRGRLQQSTRMSQLAMQLAEQSGQPERAALYESAAAVCNAFAGKTSEARQKANASLDASKGRDVEYGAGFALALSGDSSRSEALANDLEKRYSEDTSVRFTYVPTLRALIALNNNEPRIAVEILQSTGRYESAVVGTNFNAFFGGMYPAYVRGEAFLAAHQGREAAAEFQRIIDSSGVVLADPVGAMARLQLARALNMSGDKTKASAVYQNFLNIWKNADPDIAILQQAKSEYAALK